MIVGLSLCLKNYSPINILHCYPDKTYANGQNDPTKFQGSPRPQSSTSVHIH